MHPSTNRLATTRSEPGGPPRWPRARPAAFLGLLALLLAACGPGGEEPAGEDAGAAATPPPPGTGSGDETSADGAAGVGEAPGDGTAVEAAAAGPEPWRIDLLRMAREAVLRMPDRSDMWIRERSRGVQRAVEAALEIGAHEEAEALADSIENWRRGVALAEIAWHRVRQDDADEARVRALLAAAEAEVEGITDWRGERVRVNVARTLTLLGDRDRAATLERGVAEAEQGKVDAARALLAEPADADPLLQGIDAAVLAGNFDVLRNVLLSADALYGRFYDDEELRARIEERILEGSRDLPAIVRVDVLEPLVETALDRGDAAAADRLLDDIRAVVDEGEWNAEFGVQVEGRIARLRALAGQDEIARRLIDEALARFDREERTVAQIFQCTTLRPVAEALVALGDREGAADLYARIVEIGAGNPNARPRSTDLADTCLSMAVAGFRPGDALLARMREILDSLDGEL